MQDGKLRRRRAAMKRNQEVVAAIRRQGSAQHWLCADDRRMLPKDMKTAHKINVLRMHARGLMRDTDLQYGMCVSLAIARHALLFEMACQVAEAGEDPFKDQGGVLAQEDADGDYPLSDFITLKGERKCG